MLIHTKLHLKSCCNQYICLPARLILEVVTLTYMHHFIPHVILMTGRQTLHHVHGVSSHHFWALVIGHGVTHCHFHLYSEAQNKPMRH